MTRSSQAQPEPVVVREELQRILHSGCVPAGSMLARILTYVVERTLEGDGKSIKAYTIAVEALGRTADFDPDRDSTVRVAAMRLRSALDLYYSGAGAANAMRIRMVPGSYRPSFETNEAVPADVPAAMAASVPPSVTPGLLDRARLRMPSTRVWLAALSTIVAVDVVVTLSLMALQMRGSEIATARAAPAVVQQPVKMTAEKHRQPREALVYDYIQHQVQASLGQSLP
jgi:hypothetical protein